MPYDLQLPLSLKEKIGQLFMLGFKGVEMPEETRKFIESYNIGFIVLFARNVESIPQVKELTCQIHSSAKTPPFIFTDQEGGTVVQFKELAATVVSPMGLAATGEPGNARIAGRIIGEEMKSLGINGVLAPVLDVNFEEKNPIIGIRSFSDEPATVIAFAREFAAGLNDGGVASCGKHYPGHGGTTADSHLEIPQVPVSPEYFFHYCFQPFLSLARTGIDAIMSSHVLFPALSPRIATFCPYLIQDLLRQKAGYDGIVMSDCMEMLAVKNNYSPEVIMQQAIAAGLDLVIASHTQDFQKELLDTLFFHVQKGIIPEKRIDQSLARILKIKEKFPSLIPENRKKLTPLPGRDINEKIVRSHLKEEEKIADRSITLLRDRKGLVPIKPGAKTLILEWEKVKATMPLSSAEKVSMLAPTAKEYLDHVELEILPLVPPQESTKSGKKIPEDLEKRLKDYDCIITGLYSRSPRVEQLQAETLKEIINLRNDVIVVALGNPYDIRNFPYIDTYVVTYGFRKVQVDSLFKVLTGKIKPGGRLPVQIKNLFPRGFALQEQESEDDLR